jgi:FkbM family methyltransferase
LLQDFTARAGDIVPFNFTLVPAHSPEELHANIRSSVARGLPAVTAPCAPNDDVLSVAGGGPSLADTYQELEGCIAAINGSLTFLLNHDVVPTLCGVCDPSPHMVDIVEADRRITYFLASIVHPTVYDKLLKANCTVYRWNGSSVPGAEKVLDEIEPNYFLVGGGSTMGLRWITLGYAFGFRKFHLHGMDSSFRVNPERASHAYPDHQDNKEWIGFEGYQTRVNFIGQVCDFIGWMERLKEADADPVEIRMFGDGLLQSKFRQWKEQNPGWHEGGPKPENKSPSDGFKWPEMDKRGKLGILHDVAVMPQFLKHIARRGVVVQAGGNVGVYPAHLAPHFREVYTFEPDKKNYECLVENLASAKGKIAAYNAALGEVEGECGLSTEDNRNVGAIRVGAGKGVQVRTIDALNLYACDLIWLDIEGYELPALKGAKETIEKFWPAVIIEDNGLSEKHGIPAGSAVEWLHDMGYFLVAQYGNDKLFAPSC